MSHAISAGGVVPILRDNEVYLPMVTTLGGKISFPKGHLEEGETEETAARREITEETGLIGLTVIKKLGTITRLGTEHDGSVKQKDIHLFLMKAADIVFDHEDDFVWVPLNAVLTLLQKKEEAEFVSAHLGEIRAAAQTHLTVLDQTASWDAAHRLPSLRNEASRLKIMPTAGESVLQVGIGDGRETATLLEVEGVRVKVMEVSSVAVAALRKRQPAVPLLEIVQTDVHDALSDELPTRIDLFMAHGSLNMSDTKVFYFLNEVVRKMPVGGHLSLEGATAGSAEVQGAKTVGKNIVLTGDGRLIRLWNAAFVEDALVGRLRLERLNVDDGAPDQRFHCVLRKKEDYDY